MPHRGFLCDIPIFDLFKLSELVARQLARRQDLQALQDGIIDGWFEIGFQFRKVGGELPVVAIGKLHQRRSCSQLPNITSLERVRHFLARFTADGQHWTTMHFASEPSANG